MKIKKQKIQAAVDNIIYFQCPSCQTKALVDVDNEVRHLLDIDYQDRFVCEECGEEFLGEIGYDMKPKFTKMTDNVESATNTCGIAARPDQLKYREDEVVSAATPPYRKREIIKSLQDKLINRCAKWFREDFGNMDDSELTEFLPELGYNDLNDMFVVEVALEDDGRIRAEVRAELSYDGLYDLGEACNPIVQKYDKEAYFDMDQPGIMSAYLDLNGVYASRTSNVRSTRKVNCGVDPYEALYDGDPIILDDDEVFMEIEVFSGGHADGFEVNIWMNDNTYLFDHKYYYGRDASWSRESATANAPYVADIIEGLCDEYGVNPAYIEVVPGKNSFTGKPVSDKIVERFRNDYIKAGTKVKDGAKPIHATTDKEIYDYLKDLGGYVDYDGKVDSLVEDFGMTRDEAEGYVWNYASGLYKLDQEDDESELPSVVDTVGWLEDHEQAYSDACAFFHCNEASDELYHVDQDALISWISEHDQLAEDYLDYFGLTSLDDYIGTSIKPNKSKVTASFEDWLYRKGVPPYEELSDDEYSSYFEQYENELNLEQEESFARRDVESSASVKAANYGGAFDIDPESYFTREDLDELGDSVAELVAIELEKPVQYIEGYIEPNNDLSITLSCEDFEETEVVKIDMRRIRRPNDLVAKYAEILSIELAAKLKADLSESEGITSSWDGLPADYDAWRTAAPEYDDPVEFDDVVDFVEVDLEGATLTVSPRGECDVADSDMPRFHDLYIELPELDRNIHLDPGSVAEDTLELIQPVTPDKTDADHVYRMHGFARLYYRVSDISAYAKYGPADIDDVTYFFEESDVTVTWERDKSTLERFTLDEI